MSQGESNPDGNTQASRFINEFPVFTNQIDLLIAKYEKLVDTEATQLDEINSLKVMVADKDEKIRIHEQRCRELQEEANELRANLEKTKKEHDVKVSELEKKLKAKEEEVGKMINKVEETANSMTWGKAKKLELRLGCKCVLA
ncbi:CAP-Gly domain-containing linker 1 [Gossypium arboreum]|uniref:CAP-Gly domain-containing linker 1 n=1 Tax=Gossypium arboreum TaxID=29729 RepID=A0A0B0N9Y0_GOSAR|nr:CAP-Gly domain-containing linker 1 [Gossypium arboreum]